MEYDNFFLPSPYRIQTFQTSVQYGLSDRWTMDANVGFGKIEKISDYYPLAGVNQENPSTTKQGILDSRIGIRKKILDEFESNNKWIPTLSIRIGYIQKGDYNPKPQSLGDGVSGWETNLYFAKDFGWQGFGTFGELQYRRRENPVPPDRTYAVSFYKTFGSNIYLFLGVRDFQSQGGNAFADLSQNEPLVPQPNTANPIPPLGLEPAVEAQFRAQNFPDSARREKFFREEISLGYMDNFSNFYTITYAKTKEGLNTPLLEIVSLAVNFPFYL